jgi:hypothetical protein
MSFLSGCSLFLLVAIVNYVETLKVQGHPWRHPDAGRDGFIGRMDHAVRFGVRVLIRICTQGPNDATSSLYTMMLLVLGSSLEFYLYNDATSSLRVQ